MIYREKKPFGTIPEQWMKWYPYVGYRAGFWITVARLVKERRVAKTNRQEVISICNEVFPHLKYRSK